MAEEERSTEITTPIFSAKLKGMDVQFRDLLLVVAVAISPIAAYMLWEHKEDSKMIQREFVGAVKEMVVTQREQNQISREQVCLLRFGTDRRENVADYCKQISR